MAKVYQEHPKDTWGNDGTKYLINKIFQLAHGKTKVELSINDLNSKENTSRTSVENKLVCGSCYQQGGSIKDAKQKHLKRVEETNIKTPLIVLRVGDKYRIVDGTHRLEKAMNSGVLKLPVKILNEDEIIVAKV